MQRWRLANNNIGKPRNIIWERGGWEKGRERKEKPGEERKIICPASSVEQANGDLWSVRSTSSEVLEYTPTQSEANLIKELSLLWGRKRSRPFDLSARWLYSQPLSRGISNTSFYFWKKRRWDRAAIINGGRTANLYVKVTICAWRNKEGLQRLWI